MCGPDTPPKQALLLALVNMGLKNDIRPLSKNPSIYPSVHIQSVLVYAFYFLFRDSSNNNRNNPKKENIYLIFQRKILNFFSGWDWCDNTMHFHFVPVANKESQAFELRVWQTQNIRQINLWLLHAEFMYEYIMSWIYDEATTAPFPRYVRPLRSRIWTFHSGCQWNMQLINALPWN